MNDIVKVVPYDSEWPYLFAEEAKLLQRALRDNCIAIHHIGSTAVPELSAKPIIDILAVVRDILQVDQATTALEHLGYKALGEYGIPFRRFFQKAPLCRTHHLHVFEQDNPEIERHLKFRDWMRAHAKDRDGYGKLKAELALKFPYDRMNYCMGKEAFIVDIDTKTGFNGLAFVVALKDREWEAVRHFCQKYFFDRVSLNDPYTWTFKHNQHVHFVLYKGTKIVGYTHIQLWPEQRAALRIIVIDVPYRNQDMGSELLKLCERWLLQQNIKKLLVQSSPEAYPFYCNNNYIKMPFDDPDDYESDPRDIEVGKNLK